MDNKTLIVNFGCDSIHKEDWNDYQLDSTNDGLKARKPDSLFIEAIK